MAFNGSGTFVRDNGSNTGATIWEQSRDAGTKITVGEHDTHDEDIAGGLTNCITKDGQQTVTANIPFAAFELTNVGAGTTRTAGTNVAQVQDGAVIWGGTSTGAANVFDITLSPAITAYTAGLRVAFKAHQANTISTPTLNVNSVGANVLQRPGGTALRANEIILDQIVEAVYDGANFILTSRPSNSVQLDVDKLLITGQTANQALYLDGSNEVVSQAAATFRSNITAAASGSNSDITAMSGLTTLSWSPTLGAGGSMTYTSTTVNNAEYVKYGKFVHLVLNADGTTGGSADPVITFTLPSAADSTASSPQTLTAWVVDGGNKAGFVTIAVGGTTAEVRNYDASNWGLGAGRSIVISGTYLED